MIWVGIGIGFISAFGLLFVVAGVREWLYSRAQYKGRIDNALEYVENLRGRNPGVSFSELAQTEQRFSLSLQNVADRLLALEKRKK